MTIANFDGDLREVKGLSAEEKRRAMDFIQGAVYCWCKNQPGEWFAARDLFGGDNNDWSGTPLQIVYDNSKKKSRNPANINAVRSAAAKGVGWLVKKVLHTDKRKFESKDLDIVKHYRWLKP